jgi:hypothetical protein
MGQTIELYVLNDTQLKHGPPGVLPNNSTFQFIYHEIYCCQASAIFMSLPIFKDYG